MMGTSVFATRSGAAVVPEEKEKPKGRTTGGWRTKKNDADKETDTPVSTKKTVRYSTPVVETVELESDHEDEVPLENDETQKTKSRAPELPYKDVKPIEFVPLDTTQMQKAAAKARREPIPNLEHRQPAFKNKAQIESEEKDRDLLQKILDTPVNVKTEDLLSASKSLREELKKLLSRRQVPTKDKPSRAVTITEEVDIESPNYRPESTSQPFEKASPNYQQVPDIGETELVEDHYVPIGLDDDALEFNSLPQTQYFVSTKAMGTVPAGSLIHQDPYMQYLETLAPGEAPKQVFVAKESNALRAVYPNINGHHTEESILDGGSQIVSMARTIAESLMVSWDPDIKIHMQSANNQVELSCGLAKNIPFRFNEITLYLQVHIIEAPAYKVLLGRPFDSLTRSVIQNGADGGQIVTITDPNTNQRATIPTYARGSSPRVASRSPPQQQVFQRSMI